MTFREGRPCCPKCATLMRLLDAGEQCSLWICSCGEAFVYERAPLRHGLKQSANPV